MKKSLVQFPFFKPISPGFRYQIPNYYLQLYVETGKMMGVCDNEIRKGQSYLQKLSQPYIQYLPVGIQMTFDVGVCDGGLLFFYGEVCSE